MTNHDYEALAREIIDLCPCLPDDMRDVADEVSVWKDDIAALLRERLEAKTCPHCHCQYVIHTNETTELYECACGATADKKAPPALPTNWQEAIREAARILVSSVAYWQQTDANRIADAEQIITAALAPLLDAVRRPLQHAHQTAKFDVNYEGPTYVAASSSAMPSVYRDLKTALALLDVAQPVAHTEEGD